MRAAVDINLFLEPSDNISLQSMLIESKLKELFLDASDFLSLPNIPHISLYQFRIDEDRLDDLLEAVEVYNFNPVDFKMDTHLSVVCKNVFWRSTQAKEIMKEMHTDCVNHFKQFKSDQPLSQINLETLTLMQKKLVDEYGSFFCAPGSYDPHITLLYQLQKDIQLDGIEIPELVCTASKIKVARIGYHGNIEEVLF